MLDNRYLLIICFLILFSTVVQAQVRDDLMLYVHPPPGSIEVLPSPGQTTLDAVIEKLEDLEKDEAELDNLIGQLRERDLPEFTSRDAYCLARNLFHEAANEPEEGIVAVGVVTLNRLAHPNYPKSVCDVVYQRGVREFVKKKQRRSYIICQFSWTCERIRVPQDTDPRWIRIQQIATQLLDVGYPEWKNKYKNSLHYHAFYVNPRWPLKRLFRTGAHIFYN